MNILAFDISSANISLAIAKGDKVIFNYNKNEPYAAMSLINLLDNALKEVKLKPKDIDLIALGAGPGSFTGLRISFSVAKAWGLAIPKSKIITIGSFYSMANQVSNKFKKIAVITDARRDCIYAACYNTVKADIKLEGKELLTTLKEFVSKKKDYTFVTYDDKLREKVLQLYPKINFHPTNIFPQAQYLISVAIKKYKQKQFSSLEKLEPLYLHPKTCQIK